MLGITFGLSYVILYIWLPSYTKHGEEIKVPLLENLTVEEAQTILEENHLRIEILDTVYKVRYQPGAITRQEPIAKSMVKENRRIYVSINSFATPTIQVDATKMEYLEDYNLGTTKSKITAYKWSLGKIREVQGKHKNHVNYTFYKGDTLRIGMEIPIGAKIDIETQNGAEKNEDY